MSEKQVIEKIKIAPHPEEYLNEYVKQELKSERDRILNKMLKLINFEDDNTRANFIIEIMTK